MSDVTPPLAAHVPNLLDRSRFAGPSVVFVEDGAEALAAGATTVVVDLDRCQNPSLFVVDGLVAIGFGSHVEEDRLAEAAGLGFSEVMARSVFFRRLPSLLEHS